MTQPVLFKQSFLIAHIGGATGGDARRRRRRIAVRDDRLFGSVFDPSSAAIVIVAVVCLVLIQPPREVNAQLTSARVSAVVDVMFRWLLVLAVLLAIGYVTKSPLQAYPRRDISDLGRGHPGGADRRRPSLMQELMRHFLMNAFDIRSAIFAGYNNSSLELARRLQEKSRPCASK